MSLPEGEPPAMLTVFPVAEGHHGGGAPLRGAVSVEMAAVLQALWFLWARPWSSKEGAWGGKPSEAYRSTVVSPRTLLAFRLCAFVYCWALGVQQVASDGPMVLKFYTFWNWVALTTYFGLGAVNSARAQLRTARGGRHTHSDWMDYAQIALLHTNMTCVWVVDVLHWALLWPMLAADPDPVQRAFWEKATFNWVSYNTHGPFNVVLLLAELSLNAIPLHPYMLGYAGLWSSGYGLWALLHYVLTGKWLYPFLDTTRPWSTYVYLSVVILHWVAFGAFALLDNGKRQALSWLHGEGTGLRHMAAAQSTMASPGRGAMRAGGVGRWTIKRHITVTRRQEGALSDSELASPYAPTPATSNEMMLEQMK